MSSTYSKNIKLTIFGASHEELMGIVIDNICAGIPIDVEYIQNELARRRGGPLASPRQEKDSVKIVSGYFNGYTTGAPLTFILENKDVDSSRYEKIKDTPRPSHADYALYEKSFGFNDYRGGGTSSGRLTSLIVAAGAFFKKILSEKGIKIESSFTQIGNRTGEFLDPDEINDYIYDIASSNDSVGGEIKVIASGVEAGIGEPFFDSMESTISQLMFSIPGVKGVSFGLGEAFKEKRGSEVADEFVMEDGKVVTKTNNNGGINGGITNGMPIVAKVVVKATPSFKHTFDSVDLKTKKNTKVEVDGRFDPCILLKMPPIVEAVMAFSIMDQMVGRFGYIWMK